MPDQLTLRIHSIETLAAHDGPGLRCVIFLQGCRFRCVYCHNPDTWNEAGGEVRSIEELVQQVKRVAPYFGEDGGVTVSGGEPLLQRQALTEFFRRCHEEGIHTVLDTNGSVFDDATKKLLEVTDLVLLDIKHINPVLHKKLTQTDNAVPLQVAEYLESIKKPFWLRYVLVPGWTDQVDALDKWAKHFQEYRSIERVEILPYHTLGVYKYKAAGLDYKLNGVSRPTKEKSEEAKKIFEKYLPNVFVK